jgi:hypothetical protein
MWVPARSIMTSMNNEIAVDCINDYASSKTPKD